MSLPPVILKSISFKSELDNNQIYDMNNTKDGISIKDDDQQILTKIKSKFSNKIYTNPDNPVSFYQILFFGAKIIWFILSLEL